VHSICDHRHNTTCAAETVYLHNQRIKQWRLMHRDGCTSNLLWFWPSIHLLWETLRLASPQLQFELCVYQMWVRYVTAVPSLTEVSLVLIILNWCLSGVWNLGVPNPVDLLCRVWSSWSSLYKLGNIRSVNFWYLVTTLTLFQHCAQ
jgi:hypothetical protein